MPKTNFAPWSAETAQGIKTDPVDSNIRVNQEVIPAITVGTVNSITGEWEGILSSDDRFTIDPTHEAVGNGAAVLSPQLADHDYIDMTGFRNLLIALKITNTGNFGIEAVMGPDTHYFSNLSPVDSASPLRAVSTIGNNFDKIVSDSVEVLTADVWEILSIQGANLAGQANLQFKLTNNSGGPSDIQFAYLRLV